MAYWIEQKADCQSRARQKTKMGFWKKFCICIVILAGIGYGIWHDEDFQRKYMYPYPYRQFIEYYADRYQMDECLIAGVALAESKFEPTAQSVHGAQGIMQIMPETAAWIAYQIEDDDFSAAEMYEPEKNIKYGTWYLASLNEEFFGNKVLMLAAYNAGRGNVHEWMEKYGWDENFSDYKQIPFPETREYVQKVLKYERKYKKLYK
ncbi:lytic transglycosylase domain-containing protein [Megamonas hypermegale]|uniref:lytic transglycosylase domain-containing protein n=1 Tax=Megamonas hypermegale TaxID=158847 RepID=UPI0026F19E88|nr:lytic transglycosylase domain-containing protein [Megamonas hypermegale]